MRKLSLLPVFILALMLVPACGGGGDDDDDTATPDADTSPTYDAAPQYDAAPSGVTLGETCNGSPGMADCEAGLECLSLTGGSAPWCSEECSTPSCGAGYTGPGLPYCYLQIDFGGGDVRNFCGIICEDISAGVCTAGCDGTCPGDLQCTADITDMGGNVVAKGCQ